MKLCLSQRTMHTLDLGRHFSSHGYAFYYQLDFKNAISDHKALGVVIKIIIELYRPVRVYSNCRLLSKQTKCLRMPVLQVCQIQFYPRDASYIWSKTMTNCIVLNINFKRFWGEMIDLKSFIFWGRSLSIRTSEKFFIWPPHHAAHETCDQIVPRCDFSLAEMPCQQVYGAFLWFGTGE